jgi:hypothetical protein
LLNLLRRILDKHDYCCCNASPAGGHIRRMLPTLRRQINEALEAKLAELKSYGPALDLDSETAR